MDSKNVFFFYKGETRMSDGNQGKGKWECEMNEGLKQNLKGLGKGTELKARKKTYG